MAGAAILGQSRKLVSALRAQPRTETGRNAGNRKAAWGPVPTGYLQEWPHSSLVGLRTWALLESISSQREEWNAEERDLAPGVLQPSAKVSYEAQHRSNERSRQRSRRHMLVYGVCQQQSHTNVATCSRTSLASATDLCCPRHLVSEMRP